jgi:hypothetical protein
VLRSSSRINDLKQAREFAKQFLDALEAARGPAGQALIRSDYCKKGHVPPSLIAGLMVAACGAMVDSG